MMALRRAKLSLLGAQPARTVRPFADLRVSLDDYEMKPGEGHAVPEGLAEAVANRLARGDTSSGPGAAIVSGVSKHFDVPAARNFHEALFRDVWQAFRKLDLEDPAAGYRVKTGVITDGAIPIELYGSAWSFKKLHIDREVLLFSHHYGPVAGFTGGNLLLVDIQPYMSSRSLTFDDVFEWSEEATQGSKPVLREHLSEDVFAEGGIDCGAIGPDEIVFLNNMPGAGILHGVTPVSVNDRETFVREYHRCTVKESA
jgi:hypothetical protein